VRVLLVDRSITNGYVLGLARGLRVNEVEVLVGGPAHYGEPTVLPLYPRVGVPGKRVSKLSEAVGGMFRFQHLLVSRRPDFLHVQWPTDLDVAYAVLAKRIFRVPLAYTVHNPTGRVNQPEPHPTNQRRLISLADLVLTHGPLLRERVIHAHPHAERKTFAVEHGNYEHIIEHRYTRAEARAKLELEADGPVFTFAGQLSPRKGLDLLIEAFTEYSRRGHSGTLLIAGIVTDPDYELKLRQLASGCEASVRWIISRSTVTQTMLDMAISAATQVVLPFPDASQSGSLILAMTHGRCVVSTMVGEISRTLKEKGIPVAPGGRGELIRALELAERDPELCDELGSRARRYALEQLSWSEIAAKTLRLYKGELRGL